MTKLSRQTTTSLRSRMSWTLGMPVEGQNIHLALGWVPWKSIRGLAESEAEDGGQGVFATMLV